MLQTEFHFYQEGQKHIPTLPLGSARGCKQTLELLSSASSFRTITGELVAFPGTEKYSSILECEDLYPISFEGLSPGMTLWVECLVRIMTPHIKDESRVLLKRMPVLGSLLFHQEGELPVPIKEREKEALLLEKHTGGYVSYRPLLKMILKKFSTKTQEWERVVGWRMELEEV